MESQGIRVLYQARKTRVLDVQPKKTMTFTLRQEAKLSQGQLARKADLDPGTVSSAENIKKNISDNTRTKLASTFTDLLKREIKPEEL